ncbi:cortistatin precursor [Oryctolagus cuniculus]|uniref:Cortistatin n=1 Tax=Oryctolagus cuniculus TaxID=9986 RepID=G1TTP6_RABIT|nr:cortistatin precursor [Oryctolagus cuniculus]
MGRRRARGVLLPPGLLLLLLSGAAATATLALDGGTGQDSQPTQEGAAAEQSGLLTFLARWHAWTAQARGTPSRGDTGAMSRRQQGPPPPPAPPCRNFFWKTFSSCK